MIDRSIDQTSSSLIISLTLSRNDSTDERPMMQPRFEPQLPRIRIAKSPTIITKSKTMKLSWKTSCRTNKKLRETVIICLNQLGECLTKWAITSRHCHFLTWWPQRVPTLQAVLGWRKASSLLCLWVLKLAQSMTCLEWVLEWRSQLTSQEMSTSRNTCTRL